MKMKRKLAPSKYLRRYGKAKIAPVITKEEVEAVLECEITDERYEELLEASRTYSLSNSDKHVNLAQDAEHNRDWEGAKKHWKNAALASIKHDAHKGTNRSDKLKVRGITMRKEEVEQIDELSKKTLGSYIKKADNDKIGVRQHTSLWNRRTKGIGNAVDKLTKEEVEQIEEKDKYQVQHVHDYGASSSYKRTFAKHSSASQHRDQYAKQLHAKYGNNPDDDDSAIRVRKVDSKTTVGKNKDSYDQEKHNSFRSKSGKRLRGKLYKKAHKKFYGEEVEQIDELSSETKKSYTKKAKADVELLSKAVKWHKDSSRPSQYKNKSADKFLIAKHTKKINKRNKGISQANEEVEPINELSRATLDSYIKKTYKHGDKPYRRAEKRKDAQKLSMEKQAAGKKWNEAVELSASRKTKVNALLAKHQAKGLPAKPSKKYTREYTGDGLPQIMATINQEETINETKE